MAGRAHHHDDVSRHGWPACAHPPSSRALAATLVVLRNASLLALLVLVLASNDPPITPPVLVWLFTMLVILPTAAAWLLARVRAARVDIHAGTLVVAASDLRLEVRRGAIARVAAWRAPLPGPGVSLHLRPEDERHGLQMSDPFPVLAALADIGVESARQATRHPIVVWAHARAALPAWRLPHYAAKFLLFALLPAAVLFNAHQHIAFGGLFGEYYLVGPGAWLRTFGVYWITVAIYLVLWASFWRGLAEGTTLLVAALAPAHAARARVAAELACRALYYGGVPILLLLRFSP